MKDYPPKDTPKEPAKAITVTTTTTATDDDPQVGALLADAQHGWWDTYNAAITGMCQYQPYLNSGAEYIHIQATLIANAAHGPYPPDPEPPPPPPPA